MNPTKVLRAGVIGAGRIGKIHAENLARHIPGACVAAHRRPQSWTRARRLPPASPSPGCGADYREILADPADRRRRDLLLHRHARAHHRRGRRGPASTSSAKNRSTYDLAQDRRGPGSRARRPACSCRSASTAASTPTSARVRADGRRGRDRRAAHPAHHQPRPGPAAASNTSRSRAGSSST